MVRRLSAVALALVILGAPLAAEICDARCADHGGHLVGGTSSKSDGHHGADAARASHHHQPSQAASALTTSRVALTPLTRACEHLDAVVTESRDVTRASIVKATVRTVRLTGPSFQALGVFLKDRAHDPPRPIRSIPPLRI